MHRQSSNATSRKPASRWRLATRVAVALFVVIGLATPASAGFFQFATNVTILNGYMPPASVVANNNTPTPTITTPMNTVITLDGQESASPGDNYDATGAGSDIVFSYITVAPVTSATPFEAITIPYVFHVIVTDYATSNAVGALGSATFDIQGELTGSVGAGKKVNLSTNMYDPGNILTKQIGNDFYTLDLNFYVPPGPSHAGAFGVHVTAVPIPEPTTIGLLGFGLLAMATPAYRRWRRRSRARAD